jgi:uncharacterized membrane protein
MFFTDAVFAIAMTLLVAEIGVPETIAGAADDPAALFEAFQDRGPRIFAFFLGCYVIGSYWAAHHRFMAWVEAVDRGFVALTVVYLSFVALLPFPTGVLGDLGAGRLRRALAGHRRMAPEHAAAAAHEQVPTGGHRAVHRLDDCFRIGLRASSGDT